MRNEGSTDCITPAQSPSATPTRLSQDIMRGMFLRNMTCLPFEYNCRIYHASRTRCYGYQTEGDVFEGVRIVHSKLGECPVARLLPRTHELWLRHLPPGRRQEVGDNCFPPWASPASWGR